MMKKINQILFIFLIVLTCGGASCQSAKLAATKQKTDKVDDDLNVESQALTTAIVDVLIVAPTNKHSNLALNFAKRDQQIEGIPSKRIDTVGLLNETNPAHKRETDSLNARFELQEKLLAERQENLAKLKVIEQNLIEMGKLYEGEKNKNLWSRIYNWTMGTLGIGGLIALVVFFPVLIPIFGSLLGSVVNAIPSLAGFLGLVSKKAFDSVVAGVDEVRTKWKTDNKAALSDLDTSLNKATDQSHKALITLRKKKMKL